MLIAVLLVLPTMMQAQFAYQTNNNATITITGYSGSGGAVSIPGTISGLNVSRITHGAFQNQFSLTSVTIPDSVVDVGAGAFYACSNFTHVTIGLAVTNIGGSAFQFTALTNLTIPDNVISIWEQAFANCPNLTTVTIGEGVTFMELMAFAGCTQLSSLTLGHHVAVIGYGVFSDCTSLRPTAKVRGPGTAAAQRQIQVGDRGGTIASGGTTRGGWLSSSTACKSAASSAGVGFRLHRPRFQPATIQILGQAMPCEAHLQAMDVSACLWGVETPAS